MKKKINKITMKDVTKEQYKQLKLYAAAMFKRSLAMCANKSTARYDAQEGRAMAALEKSGFDLNKMALAMYDLGIEKEAYEKITGKRWRG